MSIKVKVHMTAFGNPGEVRMVEVADPSPNEDGLLNQVFYYGQNDFQPQQHPSVSMGDVIETASGKLYLIKAIGFKEITRGEFYKYKVLPRRDRAFAQLYED